MIDSQRVPIRQVRSRQYDDPEVPLSSYALFQKDAMPVEGTIFQDQHLIVAIAIEERQWSPMPRCLICA